ncbi:LPS assembly protein LptD [Shigella flexneri]
MVLNSRYGNAGSGYAKRCEPRAQYFYVPYRDRRHALTYDSSLLQSDYSGLFRDRTYGDVDRPAWLTGDDGVTSRILMMLPLNV